MRLLPVAVAGIVIAAIVAGLIVSGSPQRQREIRADEQRVDELQRLSNALTRYYRDTGGVPSDLTRLVDGRILTNLPRDPVSDASYEYATTGTASYRLCARFTHESGGPPGDFWWYAPGLNCFEFDYSGIRLN